jgi:TonB-dependent starch-binding outer membrane protein SusC
LAIEIIIFNIRIVKLFFISTETMFKAGVRSIFFVCLIFFSQFISAKDITGVIRNEETKEPLPGISVQIKNTTRGSISNADGKFNLNVNLNDVLVFTAIGFEKLEYIYKGDESLSIYLKASATDLDQVVVIGYGTQRKVDITGSTASVKGEELTKQVVLTATQAIQGKVAGVQIISSGKPGSSPTVRIRGVGTALAGTATLFVVDGVLTDDISNINTADITSVDILKDASSTAIYGSRGANGVVIITTKRGVSGKLSINYNGTYGLRQASNLVEMANSEEYANYVSAASGQIIQAKEVSTDWYSKILRTGIVQQHALSISGGSEKIQNFLSLGYLNEDGIIINNNFKRFTARLNNDYTVNSHLKFGLTTSYTNALDRNVNLGSAYNNAYRAAPLIESKVDGLYGNTSLYQNVGNPILDIENSNDLTKLNRLQSSLNADLTLFKNLSFRSNIGGDLIFNNNRVYSAKFLNDNSTFIQAGGNQRNPNSNLNTSQTTSFRWVWDNILTYSKNIEAHSFKAMIGTTAEKYNMNYFTAFRKDVPAAENLWYISTGNANTSTNDGFGDAWARNSYIGRLNYNFKDTYLVTSTLRVDGSSRFPSQNRWGYFPSFGAAWVISNESFLNNIDFLQSLKLRASWGKVGNDRIDSDAYITTVEPNLAYAFGGGTATPGSAINQLKDKNIKWETTEELDFGLEFGLWKGKLQGEIGYYNKKSRDLLINVKVPSVTGDKDGVILTNAASIQNAGLEMALNFREKISNSLSYKIGGNVTLNQNKVIGLNGGQPILDGGIGAAQQYTTKTDNNQPVGSFYVLKVSGVFQSDAEIASYQASGQMIQPSASAGDFKYQDTNNDGKIDDADRVFVGSYQPKAYFGLSLGATYKAFDLSVDAYGNVGNVIYNGKKAFRQGLLDNVEKSMAYSRWSKGTGINNEPAANAGNLPASTYFVESGDFFRINNITLSYAIPTNLAKKLKATNARIFASAQNIFTFKKYTGFTPELSGDPTRAGIELNAYPTMKSLSIGLSVGF